jgi:transposase
MVRNPHLAKAILDAGWGALIQFTAYKSVMLRGLIVNERFDYKIPYYR